MDAKIVIGANWGDEGKGLMSRYFCTEALAENKNPIVVLHNGTAQRGHTVDYNERKRHIYHHFGCGTGDGVPSYFAKTFMVHPMTFHSEWLDLESEGIHPLCFYNPGCQIITIYDLLADQFTMDDIEKKTGKREYGTCGFGSWCATERNKKFTLYDFVSKTRKERRDILREAREESFRVFQSRCGNYKDYWTEEYFVLGGAQYGFLYADTNFLCDLDFFFNHTEAETFDRIWKAYNYIVFEGAQGLALDKNNGEEWHTTSNTGLKNPVEMIGNRRCRLEVCYVTRSYATRHGEGNFTSDGREMERIIAEEGEDKTNAPNDYQGSIKYGKLDTGGMIQRIRNDVQSVRDVRKIRREQVSVAMTHYNLWNGDELNPKYISRTPYLAERQG